MQSKRAACRHMDDLGAPWLAVFRLASQTAAAAVSSSGDQRQPKTKHYSVVGDSAASAAIVT